MKNLLTSVLLVLCMIACQSEKKGTDKAPSATSTRGSDVYDLPALPPAEIQKLYEEATYVDYIFYNLPFSLSQDNKASIQANLGLMSPEKATSLSTACKPIGREFFQIDGDIAYEADLYYSDGCYGYIFYRDGKPTYANALSQEGMKFYKKIISQATEVRTQGTNGQ